MNRFDVVVVGGGIVGAAIGYWLSHSARVLVLEQEMGFGYHSTGRSAAEWSLLHCAGPTRLLTGLSKSFLLAPPPEVSECALLRKRSNVVVAAADQVQQSQQLVHEAKEVLPNLVEISPEDACEMAPYLRASAIAKAYFDAENCEIDVHGLHQGFVRGLRMHGGAALTDNEVQSVVREAGVWRIKAAKYECVSPVLVNAAGAWADRFAEDCDVPGAGLLVTRRTAITFDPGMSVSLLPSVDVVGPGCYFKSEAGMLLACPGDETPTTPCDAQPEEYDIALAVHCVESFTDLTVERVLSRWAGLRAFSADRQPIVGFDPVVPGFFWAAALGGAGVMTAPAVGQLAASLLLDSPLPWSDTIRAELAESLKPQRRSAGILPGGSPSEAGYA